MVLQLTDFQLVEAIIFISRSVAQYHLLMSLHKIVSLRLSKFQLELTNLLIIYLIMSLLTWSVIATTLLITTSPRWPLYLGSWTIGSSLEITVCVVMVVAQPSKDSYVIMLVGTQTLRAIFLISLSLASLVALARTETERDIERQPLDDDQNCRRYRTISQFQDDNRYMKELQSKRLREQGWWRYLQGFLIFLPHIWPSKDRRTRLWIAVMALHLIKDLVLNVLIPRQVGILTDSLTSRAPFGRYICCQFILCIC